MTGIAPLSTGVIEVKFPFGHCEIKENALIHM